MIASLLGGQNPRVYRKTFHKVYVVIPEESYDSMEINPYEELKERGQVYHSLDDLGNLYEILKENAKRGRQSFLLIDDFGSELNGPNMVWLARLLTKSRHLRTMICLCLQTHLQLTRDMRRLLECVVLFRPNRDDFYNIMSEKFGNHKLEFFDKIYDIAYDREHSYLTIHGEYTPPRLYVRSHRLMLDDEHEPDDIEK